MSNFKQDELRAYIREISDAFELGISLSESDIKLADRSLGFKGRLPKSRSDKAFVLVFEAIGFGVISPLSLLVGPELSKISWLVGGSPNTGCKAIVGFRDNVIQLHASKSQLREWVFENFHRTPEDRREAAMAYYESDYQTRANAGAYADEVSIGRMVPDGSGYNRLELTPLDMGIKETPTIGNLPSFT